MYVLLFLYFFGGTRVQILGFVLAKQVLHHFEPHLQCILFWLFWRLGPHEIFAWAGLQLQSS
jgi:hypothetical protein